MTWSYSGNPSTTSHDSVRFLLGDTDPTDQLPISDEEIAWLLTENDDNVYFAAAASAEQVAGQFAREVPYSADGVSYGGDQLQEKFEELAKTLRFAGKRKGQVAGPYDGSNDPALSNWRRVVDQIGIGMTDNRRDGANAPTGIWPDPLLAEDDSGYAVG